MRRQRILAMILLVSGCSMMPATFKGATLVLKPQIQPSAYLTKTNVNPYTQASINHLILKLYTYDGSEHDLGIQKSIPNAQLTNSVVFSNLKASTTYRIKAYAYYTSDESQLISTTDSNSYTDVPLTNNDAPAIASLKVKLINIAFNGQATASGIVVISGGYAYSASESLVVPMNVSTLAGNGNTTFADGSGTSATLYEPYGIAVDASGNVYVADSQHHRVRKITAAGVVTTIAGDGGAGFAEGTGTAAELNGPFGVAIDTGGVVYVADRYNNRIRKITPVGVVTTFAGNGNTTFADGTGTAATFDGPRSIAVDAGGYLYVADTNNNRIRKISPTGVVTTLAGNGNNIFADGTGAAATFDGPNGIAIDSSGNMYVADSNNNRIRKVSPTGVVTTLAGNGNTTFADGSAASATFNNPSGIAVDPYGNVYVADEYNHRIRQITPAGLVTTIAGNGNTTFADGASTAATFYNPAGVAFASNGILYISDRYHNRIRRLF